MDDREPPLLRPNIPIIGHLISILWHQSVYLEKLGNKCRKPIRTLPMINHKIYLVTSPELAQSIFRSANLSLEPFLIESSARLFRSSPEATRRLTEHGEGGTPSCVDELLAVMHEGLLGDKLQKMIAISLNRASFTINSLGDVTEPESLFEWIRHTIALGTSKALFGAHDPLNEDNYLVESLGDFNDGLLRLIVGVLPSILAPKAYRGRAALQSAYGAYYLNKYDQEPDVSDLIRKRAETYRRHGIDPIEIGKREISVLQVATGNVIATMFFTLVFITADPVVTEFIRREILSAIVLSGGRNGWEEATLNISSLEELCPLLVSAYKETERIVVSQVSIRRVMRDTVISDGNLNYLLRAGADVQIPAGVSHLSKAVWGSDAAEFNFKRLLKSDAKGEATKELEKERKRAYFPFGGGKYLCPGRQYAFAQILALVAALIMGFDIRGEDGSSIQMPEIIRSRIAEATASPSDKGMRMGAKFIQRHNWENVQWKFI